MTSSLIFIFLLTSTTVLAQFPDVRNDILTWIPTIIPSLQSIQAPIQSLDIRSIDLCWYEALAPFNDDWTSILGTGIDKVTDDEDFVTIDNKNDALSYATYQFLKKRWPLQINLWKTTLTVTLGLPLSESRDTSTVAGIGNSAADAVYEFNDEDGWNQEGSFSRDDQKRMFEDYTGWEPVNNAGTLDDPDHWLPVTIETQGFYSVQKMIVPQAKYATTFGAHFDDVEDLYSLDGPTATHADNILAYTAQTLKVIEYSANLNDERKLIAEFFDNKIASLGEPVLYYGTQVYPEWTLEDWVKYDLLSHMAQVDAAIIVWKEKVKLDAVRPVNAINYLYGDDIIQAYGGYGKGTVSMLGKDYRSYLLVNAHSEFPSGSTCFCSALAQSMRNYFGTDQFGYSYTIMAGKSRFEPGITPAADHTLTFPTWTDFVTRCGLSREYGGVHFTESTSLPVKQMCATIGDAVYEAFMPYVTAGSNPDPWTVKPNEYILNPPEEPEPEPEECIPVVCSAADKLVVVSYLVSLIALFVIMF